MDFAYSCALLATYASMLVAGCRPPATYLLFLNEGWAILKALYTTYICETARVCYNFTAYNSIKSKYYQCIGFRLGIKQPKKLIEL